MQMQPSLLKVFCVKIRADALGVADWKNLLHKTNNIPVQFGHTSHKKLIIRLGYNCAHQQVSMTYVSSQILMTFG